MSLQRPGVRRPRAALDFFPYELAKNPAAKISSRMPARATAWPHAPTHQLAQAGTYIITAGTYQKLHHFKGRERLAVLQRGLLQVLSDYRWRLEAWAVFSNHYHFVAHSAAEGADSLSPALGFLHKQTAAWVNRLDKTPERKVWHNFWETKLTVQTSYLARLNYVHQNAVKHGLVPEAKLYPWCSAGWFERVASAPFVKTIYQFKTEKLRLLDDYEVAGEW